ncbi:hypothetical protein Y1Q_0003797 [Alligator mississippiensis]|uniref:Uncharacterized protein n=1 Tax=Alligator mississippiensis TaxID=8496 RepID=A0A151MN99_ALLMI|nr:hypothetical protein Y1Q_0003797 [Alligator mississippiensis]
MSLEDHATGLPLSWSLQRTDSTQVLLSSFPECISSKDKEVGGITWSLHFFAFMAVERKQENMKTADTKIRRYLLLQLYWGPAFGFIEPTSVFELPLQLFQCTECSRKSSKLSLSSIHFGISAQAVRICPLVYEI